MPEINKDFIVDGPISSQMISDVLNASTRLDIGAQSIFLGQIRGDIINNQSVTGIEYSVYEEMIEPEMQKIITTITGKYSDIQKIHILHSAGLVKVGEISLLVFVCCGHRAQAFKAVEEIVDLIKLRIPIWKKEFLEDDTHRWPENRL